MHLGELIKEYRRTHKITMEEFGNLIGKSKAYISMLENNKNSRSGKPIAPSMSTFAAVAKVLQITIDELLTSLDDEQLIETDDINSSFNFCPSEIQIPSRVSTIKDRINEALSIRNLKQIELAELSGLTRGAISSYIAGRWKPKQGAIFKIAKALNVNEAWLLGFDVPMDRTANSLEIQHGAYPCVKGSEYAEKHLANPNIRGPKSNASSNYINFCPSEMQIPLYGYVAAGEGYFADNHIEDYIHINPNDFPEGEYYGLTIKGESMIPKMESGDIIIVRKQSYPVNGKFCVMLINGDEATVKRVYVKDDGIHLIALNPNVYEPRIYTKKEIDELPITCLGVVVQIRKNV